MFLFLILVAIRDTLLAGESGSTSGSERTRGELGTELRGVEEEEETRSSLSGVIPKNWGKELRSCVP